MMSTMPSPSVPFAVAGPARPHSADGRRAGRWRRFAAAALAGAATLAGGALAGCSERPMAAAFVTAPQYKIESAAHWAIIADDVAAAVSAYLDQKVGKNAPVRLVMGRHGDTIFADAFAQDLITSFVHQGNPVAQPGAAPVALAAAGTQGAGAPGAGMAAPASAGAAASDGVVPVVITIDINAIAHSAGAKPNHTFPGSFTALAGGISVAHAAADYVPYGISAPVALAVLGVGLDAARAGVSETATELILTVSISQDGYFSYRSGAVYYIEDDELWQYVGRRGSGGRELTFNDVPLSSIGIDISGKAYLSDRR